MLSRTHRLSSTAFALAYRRGRILRHPLMQVRVWPRTDGTEPVRAAFVAPKKLGKAVQRNRVRRRIRERFRLSGALSDPKLGGCDLVFILAPEVQAAKIVAVDEALGELLRRARRTAAERERDRE